MKLNRKHRVVRVLSYACAAALAVTLSLVPAHAKTDFGVRGGAYSDESDPCLGAEALFEVGSATHWYGNPNVEHAFADSGDLTTVSFDFHYDFHRTQEYTVWAGAGPTVLFRDNSGGTLSGLIFFRPVQMVLIIVFGVLLGLGGSLVSVGRHLRHV